MINVISQEVYRQIKAMQGSQEPQTVSPQTGGVLLADMRPGAKVADMKQLFEAARRKNSFAVCIPQWFVSVAKENLVGSKIKIATVIGLPEGTNSPLAKYAEIKQAVAAGADLVLIPINMDYCRAGDTKAVQKDLAESLTASRGKAMAAAVIEVKDLDNSRIIETAQACASVGAEAIILSGIAGGTVQSDQIRDLKAKGLKVGVIGGASDAGRQSEYNQAGADWLVVRNR